MAWAIGICQMCRHSTPDQYGATHYCVFRVRHRRFSLLKWRYVRVWIWICDECNSQTKRQRDRNRHRRP